MTTLTAPQATDPRVTFATRSPRRSQGWLLSAALYVALGAGLSGQDYFSNWYVRHNPQLEIGYDSNIYGSSGNEVDDLFSTATYRITTGRAQSLTQLDLSGQVDATWFLDESEADSVDGSVQLDFAYPRDHEEGSYWEGQGYWRRETEVERTLQDRIRRTSYGLSVGGEWTPSPKLILSGGADARVTDRKSAGYATNRLASFSAGIGHSWIPERRWFLEYTLELGESDPPLGIESTESVSHIVGMRVRGRILPKITGTALLGYEHSTFSGREDFSDSGLSGALDVRWEASALSTVELSGRRRTEFSPSGAVTRRSTVTLSVDRDFGPAFTLLADVTPDVISYDTEENRKDRILNLGVGLRYRRTSRFFAMAHVAWGKIDSNLPDRDAEQTVVSLRSGLEF